MLSTSEDKDLQAKKNVSIEENQYNTESFLPANIVSKKFPNSPVTTTLLDSVFILSSRSPRKLSTQPLNRSETLGGSIHTEPPLLSKRLSQPYWNNARPFDTVVLDVYGRICLALDRHLLESIVSIGGVFENLSTLSLRSAISLTKLDVSIKHMPLKYQVMLDTLIFRECYQYFLVDIANLLKLMGLSIQKKNRHTCLQRLNRLSQMLLSIHFEEKGRHLKEFDCQLYLVDQLFIPLIAMNDLHINAKRRINEDFFTHIIVGVNKTFTSSLAQDGAIDRQRFLSIYPRLNGRHSVIDFFKYIDQHDRSHFHQKKLRSVITYYIEIKAMTVSVRVNRLTEQLYMEIIKKKKELKDNFNLTITGTDIENPKSDARFIHSTTS